MSEEKDLRLRKAMHPGGFIKHQIIEPIGLSVTDAASALGVTRPALSTMLNERARLSPEMALRIEKAFGISMEMLMQMQNTYDIALIRARADKVDVKRYVGTNTKEQK